MSTTTARPPTSEFAYEDFVVGETIPFGHIAVTAEAITRYARAFDPQPFHLSEDLAKDTNIGRLIASGYHTCCMIMRMGAEDILGGPYAMGSPGLDEVKFLKPVFPGDEISARCTTLDKRELKSKPGVGLIHCSIELLNGKGEAVMSWDMKAFRRSRSA